MKNDNFIVVAFAVIDTNVIVSSMLGNKPSSTKDVLNLVESGNILPLFDMRMIKEYWDVLNRFFTEDIVVDKLSSVINNGFLVTNVEETKTFFKDKDDIPFFEVMESSKELDAYLITGNTKHFPEGTTRTAAFVMDVLKYLNGFVLKDKESYLKEIRGLIDSLDKEKYLKQNYEDILSPFMSEETNKKNRSR